MSVRKRVWTTRTGETKEAWVVDYVDQDGRRHLRTFSKKKNADAYHAQVNVDVAEGIHTPISRSITLKQAAADWLAYVQGEGRERATTEAYRSHIDVHIVPRLGHLKLATLTTPRINAFRDELIASTSARTGERMTRVMARKVLASLKAIIKEAKRRGNVAQNVASDVSIKIDRRSRRKLKVGVDIPTADEIKRMIAVAHGRKRAILIVAAFTGLRSSELRGLRWQDVELDGPEPKLHVRQRADRYRVMGAPKSETSEREMPLGPFVANTLRHWRGLEKRGELVFANNAGNVEFHQTIAQRHLQPVQIAAGITKLDDKGRVVAKYPGLHCLRHFYASWLINRKEDGGLGLPLKLVQAWLGHATLAMTADTYGHLFPSSDQHSELAAAEQTLGLNEVA
jgi:integrase